MALLDELKKLITKVENDKAACEQSAQRSAGTFNASNQGGEDMDDKEKVENEKVDKRYRVKIDKKQVKNFSTCF